MVKKFSNKNQFLIVCTLVISGFAVLLSFTHNISDKLNSNQTKTHTASTTQAQVLSVSQSNTSATSTGINATTTATSTSGNSAKTENVKPTTTVQTSQNPPISSATTTVASVPHQQIAAETSSLSFDDINRATRDSLVNILCVTKSAGSLNPITGTGVVIHPSGIILTNAHIAQYFLLKDLWYPNYIECSIRTGNPAQAKYTAKLLYISSDWIEQNVDMIKSQNPKGTGESDFALIAIGNPIDGSKRPAAFPYVMPDYQEKDRTNDDVLIAAYPAGFLGGVNIQKELYSVSTIAKVSKAMSFTGHTYDFLALTGNVAAQKGSSGGAVVSSQNLLTGLIVTVTEALSTADRELGAITLSHIHQSFSKQTGLDLATFLNEDTVAQEKQFSTNTLPRLQKLLTDVVRKRE